TESPTGRKVWAILSVLVCAAGMATKEVAITAPIVVLLYDTVFIASSFPNALRRGAYYASLAATLGIAAGFGIGDPRLQSQVVKVIGPFQYALNEPAVILHYLRLAFYPSPLILDYSQPPRPMPELIAPMAIVLFLLAL